MLFIYLFIYLVNKELHFVGPANPGLGGKMKRGPIFLLCFYN